MRSIVELCLDIFISTRETYVERERGETANDRNDRAIREAGTWYRDHLSGQNSAVQIVLITNDADNRAKAKQKGLIAFTG
jgi:exosome complex exonuclease DIS3/RRP44